jgi:hypothetical protein
MTVSGTVQLEAEVAGTWLVQVLTDGWSDEEKQKLADGDQEALAALKDEALKRTLQSPDECDVTDYQVAVSSGRKEGGQ